MMDAISMIWLLLCLCSNGIDIYMYIPHTSKNKLHDANNLTEIDLFEIHIYVSISPNKL